MTTRLSRINSVMRAMQASADLANPTPEEIELFQNNNAAYQEKFAFPFVICARLNRKEAILDGFKVWLQNSRAQEIETALAEIFKIAELRLRDLTHARQSHAAHCENPGSTPT